MKSMMTVATCSTRCNPLVSQAVTAMKPHAKQTEEVSHTFARIKVDILALVCELIGTVGYSR